jgi:hypothetical protein
MAKKPTPAPSVIAPPMNEVMLTEDVQAQNQLATLELAAQENVITLAHQLGYDGSLTVGALEDGIRFYQQRTAEACLELGKRLVLLKEASLHGEFQPRLELLGIDSRAAQRFMAAAARFSKAVTSPLLKVANSQSKLLELLVLDDSEMIELAEGGTVRGMVADDIANMGVRELRAHLREAKAEKEATDKLLADKNAKIDKLSRHIAKSTPDQVLLELQKESTALMNDALGCVRGQIRQAFIAIKNHTEDDHSVFMAGLLGQLQADITALREEFNLPDVSNAADAALAAEVAQWGTAR